MIREKHWWFWYLFLLKSYHNTQIVTELWRYLFIISCLIMIVWSIQVRLQFLWNFLPFSNSYIFLRSQNHWIISMEYIAILRLIHIIIFTFVKNINYLSFFFTHPGWYIVPPPPIGGDFAMVLVPKSNRKGGGGSTIVHMTWLYIILTWLLALVHVNNVEVDCSVSTKRYKNNGSVVTHLISSYWNNK